MQDSPGIEGGELTMRSRRGREEIDVEEEFLKEEDKRKEG